MIESLCANSFVVNELVEESEKELSKTTLQYYEKHLNGLKRFIENNLIKNGLPKCDADIILSDLYLSLMTSRDYGEDINDYNYTIDSYVRNNAYNCIKRYRSAYSENLSHLDYGSVASDSESDTNSSKLDFIRDESQDVVFDNTLIDTDKCLKKMEYKRYVYGIDIYVLIMMGMVKMLIGDKPSIDRVYSNLGISKEKVSLVYGKVLKDAQFKDCLSGLSKYGINNNCLSKLRQYVYFFDDILDSLEIKLVA